MTTTTHEPPPETIRDDAWCTSTPRRGTAGGLRSVGTALDVLESFAADSALGVSDVARRLGVAKSTAHRVLTTLAGRGFVERIESLHGVRILGHSGRRQPAHCTSSGLVIAAFNPTVEYDRREAGFPPRARGRIRRIEEWDRALAETRRRGHAVLHSGSFTDASSVAVTIRVQGMAVGSISAFGPTPLLEPDVHRVVPLFTAAANRIAKQYAA